MDKDLEDLEDLGNFDYDIEADIENKIDETFDSEIINETKLNEYKLFTVDPYYDISFFNKMLVSLTNNLEKYKLFASTKSPFNWFVGIESKNLPIAIDFDVMESSARNLIVPVLTPITPQDNHIMQRREKGAGRGLTRCISNDVFKGAIKTGYICFFKVRTRIEVMRMSELYPGKIFFMGNYVNHQYHICAALNETINIAIDKKDILFETTNTKGAGNVEARFNYVFFKGRDFFDKNPLTQYVQNGKLIVPPGFSGIKTARNTWR